MTNSSLDGASPGWGPNQRWSVDYEDHQPGRSYEVTMRDGRRWTVAIISEFYWDDEDEINAWLSEHCNSGYVIYPWTEIGFESVQDAIHFKLRWVNGDLDQWYPERHARGVSTADEDL